ncbi:MBL fold metallo-hydrolase [Clostridium chauvoei]|nr:MBL fold metallo-hydrolase [Clostridium chauvoei]
MEIQWFGGTTFIIKNSIGKRILIDPMQIGASIKKYDFKVDIITLNSPDIYQNIEPYIQKECTIINSISSFCNEYLSLNSYSSFKDNIMGAKRGENIIYIFEIDGFRLCHLGTLGHTLNINFVSKLQNLDFLFIPIGGHFSLNGIDAAKLATSINSKYIIPMYYRNLYDYAYLDGPHKFLSHMKCVKKCNSTSIQTNSLDFKNSNTVLLLELYLFTK